MPYELDPDLLQAVASGPPMAPIAPAARGDHQTLRTNGETGLGAIDARLPEHAHIERVDDVATSHDGATIRVRWYGPADADRASMPGPAVVYLHGGGMIMASVDLYDRLVAGYVAETGVPMLSVDYRLAPEHPHPSPVEDGFAGLRWLVDHADGLGVDPGRLAVMGDSGGGGLAAGVVLMARDRGVPLARQLLIYPMLDDRNTTPDPNLAPFAGWSYDDNYTGWHALLGDRLGTDDVSEYAAPARAADVSGLPPTYVETGELDIFRDESIEYARRIAASGTSIELHVHPGCPHGFDRLGDIPVVRRAFADRHRVLRSI
jgi:acetyl esterase/lipase